MAFTIEDVESYYTDSLNGVTENRFDPYGENYYNRPFTGLDIVIGKAFDNRPVVQWLIEFKETVQFNGGENPRLLSQDIDKRMYRHWGQVFHNTMFGLLSWCNYLKESQGQYGVNVYLHHLCQRQIREKSATPGLEALKANNRFPFSSNVPETNPGNFSLNYLASLSEKLAHLYQVKTLAKENLNLIEMLCSRMLQLVGALPVKLEKCLEDLLYGQNTFTDEEKGEILNVLLHDIPVVIHSDHLNKLSTTAFAGQRLPADLEKIVIDTSEYDSPDVIKQHFSHISSIVKEASNRFFVAHPALVRAE